MKVPVETKVKTKLRQLEVHEGNNRNLECVGINGITVTVYQHSFDIKNQFIHNIV